MHAHRILYNSRQHGLLWKIEGCRLQTLCRRSSGVSHLFLYCLWYGSRALPIRWEVPLCRGFAPCTRRWGTNAALDVRHGSSLHVLVLTWGRMGARACGGPGKAQDVRYFPKSVPPRCDATCIRRILALLLVASQVSTAPDACRPASQAATLPSQASPMSRRVALGLAVRSRPRRRGAISVLLVLGSEHTDFALLRFASPSSGAARLDTREECKIWKQKRQCYHMKLINRTSVFWRLVASHGIPARCRASEREHSLVLAIAMLLHRTAYPEARPTHGRSAMLAPEVGGHLHLSNNPSTFPSLHITSLCGRTRWCVPLSLCYTVD